MEKEKLLGLIDQLFVQENLKKTELLELINGADQDETIKQHLIEKAHQKRMNTYGNKVFMRALIEFSNFCKCNCEYCGIRGKNKEVERYRLTKQQILHCCQVGHDLGYRTFVLQSGEDPWYTDDKIVEIVQGIKEQHPDSAVTLSLGEKSYDTYKAFYEAGADRYLLRHETATKSLYKRLHPDMSFENRRRCLKDIKEIGLQVGAGFMVGLPEQTHEDLVNDLLFLKELEPHMVGIGPFIPHEATSLKDQPAGTLEKTEIMLALTRLLLPNVLLPATTALGSINPLGRERGLKAGGNVVMPNVSPTNVRDKYLLYDGKICTGDEAAECRMCIEGRINRAGFEIDMSKGDHILWKRG